MAVHTWTDGEAITASKLNALEKKKAFVEGTLDMTTITWAEAVALQEETGISNNWYTPDSYRFSYFDNRLSASGANELLENQGGGI